MKVTENWIGVTEDGQIANLRKSNLPDNPTSKKKMREIVLASTGAIVKAKALVVNSVEAATIYVKAFFALPVKKRNGFDKYYNAFGFTNPESPAELEDEGILRLMVTLTTVAHRRVASGGAVGASAAATLAIFDAYHAVVGHEIALAEKESLKAKATAIFSTADIAEITAAQAQVPAASVNADEAQDEAEVEELTEADIVAEEQPAELQNA
jgi:hypothetical protein